MSRISSINDKKAQHEVARTPEGRVILAVYNPSDNLWFLTIDGCVDIPLVKEFESKYTDKARAEIAAFNYVSRTEQQMGKIKPFETFIPKINVDPPVIDAPIAPASAFKKENEKVKKDAFFPPAAPIKPEKIIKEGLVHLGTNDEPITEIGTLKLS